ncbi:MAG: hypothetical protein V5A62_19255 [Haloarculaceae archaeon]
MTGIEVVDGLSNRELKTIQVRLEGCIEGYERTGRCACDDFGRYERVDSIRTVRELAQFFQRLVEIRIEGDGHVR